MRSVMNISLPKELVPEIEREIKKGGFSTKSEFVRAALRN